MNKAYSTLKLIPLLLRAYILNVLIGLDLLGNAVFGGDPRETISSRLGKGKLAKKPVHTFFSYIVDFIFATFFNDKNHCVGAIEPYHGRGAISEVIDRWKAGEKKLWPFGK